MVKPKDYKDYGYKYPKILCDEIDTQTARRKNERHESWVQLVTLRWCKIPRHEWYEWAPYGVLIAWTLAFIIMIWLRPITTGVNTFS